MRVTLKNFRCHTDRTFDLPDDGLVSLVGASGAGKSTIFSAIVYALYGKMPGKKKKPYTHGKNTCSVVLEYQGLFITRTSRPCVLTVTFDEVEYEDDAAQSIIDTQMCMNYDEFVVGAYILQRSNASVLSLTPTEQVAFVEILADSNPRDKREDIKSRVKLVNEEKVGYTGELKTLRNNLKKLQSEYPEPPETPQPIEDGVVLDEVREEIKGYEEELNEKQSRITELQTSLVEKRSEEKKLADLRAKIEKCEIELSQLEQLKSNLEENPTDEGMAHSEATLQAKNQEMETLTTLLSYFTEKARFDEAVAASEEASAQRIAKLEKELEGVDMEGMGAEATEAETAFAEYSEAKAKYDYEMTKKQEARTSLVTIFKAIRASTKGSVGIKKPGKMVEFLNTEVANINKKIKKLKKKACVKWVCPCCKSNIGLNDEQELIPLGKDTGDSEDIDDAKRRIKAEQAKIDTLNSYISDILSLAPQLNAVPTDPGLPPRDPLKVRLELHRLSRVKEDLVGLQAGTLPPVLQRMRVKLDILAKAADGYEETTMEDTTATIATTKQEIDSVTSSLDRHYQIRSEHSAYDKDITAKKKSLRLARKGLPAGNDSAKELARLEAEITELTRDLISINTEISSRREILDVCGEYEAYQDTLVKIETAEAELADKESEIKQCDDTLEGLFGLDDAIKEAEVLSLQKTVRSINEHARIYLDQMFDDPIIVKLDIIETSGAKVKLKLNTVIEYKGDTYSDIEELSGGERQRCDMAFLLAVNDMLGSNILMLDECLNNLDESINIDQRDV
jgi:DNA repair exonuclease SbcCD ATPase subunit